MDDPRYRRHPRDAGTPAHRHTGTPAHRPATRTTAGPARRRIVAVVVAVATALAGGAIYRAGRATDGDRADAPRTGVAGRSRRLRAGPRRASGLRDGRPGVVQFDLDQRDVGTMLGSLRVT